MCACLDLVCLTRKPGSHRKPRCLQTKFNVRDVLYGQEMGNWANKPNFNMIHQTLSSCLFWPVSACERWGGIASDAANDSDSEENRIACSVKLGSSFYNIVQIAR